jgi:sucrose-6-phosphate hydrolase SacC (GH32 family)
VLFSKTGAKIVTCDYTVEHGLGRPQIIKAEDKYLLFYTRRKKDMKYHMGCAKSSDCILWTRIDDHIGITHSESGWDSEMVYFPSVLQKKGKTYLFYSGNGFGEKGFGFAELETW